jgi:hypothetical protein
MPESTFVDLLARAGWSCAIELRQKTNDGLTRQTFPLDAEAIDFAGASWACELTCQPGGPEDTVEIIATFRVVAGTAADVAAGIRLATDDWSEEHFLLMPAAVYAGNRFHSHRTNYPPTYPNDRLGPDMPTIIGDVHRLNVDGTAGRVQLLAGDMAWPAMAIRDPKKDLGMLVMGPDRAGGEQTGWDLCEAAGASALGLSVHAPGLREGPKYKGNVFRDDLLCDDPATTLEAGQAIELPLRVSVFDCPHTPALYARVAADRRAVLADEPTRHELPFSAAWDLLETKRKRDNWDEEHGFYATVTRDRPRSWTWHAGWCGGLIDAFALAHEGDEQSRQRVRRELDWFFPVGLTEPAGLPWGFSNGEAFIGEQDWRDRSDRPRWLLTRRLGDLLMYLSKLFMLYRRRGEEIKPAWMEGLKRLGDAACNIWREAGQFGHFVDNFTGEVLAGGTTSAAAVPGGLALAGQLLDEPDYLNVARNAARRYVAVDLAAGVTTGGPGDAMGAPDSESVAALVESLMILHDVTAESEWLDAARLAVDQAATWVMPYDFTFPSQSTFGRLNMSTLGTVFANVQNKHSAPAICTHSGAALLKLFRATGETCYLELLREIAHALPQYISREDRPIAELGVGWINERVNTSDWNEPLGEIFNASCWPEVSTMLTIAEVPGLYVQTDTGLICCIDNLNAAVVGHEDGTVTVRLSNPTNFDADVKVLAETQEDAAHPLGQCWLDGANTLHVQAGQSITATITADGQVSEPCPSRV